MGLAGAARADDLVHAVCLDDDGAVRIEDDEVARIDSVLLMTTRTSSFPTCSFVAPWART